MEQPILLAQLDALPTIAALQQLGVGVVIAVGGDFEVVRRHLGGDSLCGVEVFDLTSQQDVEKQYAELYKAVNYIIVMNKLHGAVLVLHEEAEGVPRWLVRYMLTMFYVLRTSHTASLAWEAALRHLPLRDVRSAPPSIALHRMALGPLLFREAAEAAAQETAEREERERADAEAEAALRAEEAEAVAEARREVRVEKLAALPPEPAAGAGASRVVVTLTGSRRLERRFAKESPLQHVVEWLQGCAP